MLEDGAWLRHAAHANAMAQKLAAVLRTEPAIRFVAEPKANGVFIELPPTTATALEQRGWRFLRYIGEHGYQLMCSWATPSEAIDRFAADLQTALR